MPDNQRVRSPQQREHPLPYLIIGALCPPLLVGLTAYMEVLGGSRVMTVFWVSVALIAFILAMTAFHMIAQRWARHRVAAFATSAGSAGGLCYAGMLLTGDPRWVAGAVVSLLAAFLTVLFTDLDDDVHFWAIVAAVLVPGTIIGVTFHYLQTLAVGIAG